MRRLSAHCNRIFARAELRLTLGRGRHRSCRTWRRGRVAEGGGLLNRYTLQRRIEGSNPSVSASLSGGAASVSKPTLIGRRRVVLESRRQSSTIFSDFDSV